MQKQNFTIRIDQELREQIQEQAKLQSISATEFSRKAIALQCKANAGQQEKSEKTDDTEWLKKQLEFNAHAVQIGQRLALELQAEKKALYDEIQRQKSLLERPKSRLPKFLSFLSAFAK